MAYQVALLNFEGPLDLLLQLVEQTRLAISEVSLTLVTEQYLAYTQALSDLDPFEASRFAEMAAQLLYLKSTGLISSAGEGDEQAEMAQLQQQLERYSACKQAAAALASRWSHPRRSWSRQPGERPYPQTLPRTLTLATLRQAARSAHRRQVAQTPHQVARAAVSLPEMQQRLRQAAQAPPPSLQAFFRTLDGRLEVAVAFIAALELWRSGELTLAQRRQFSPIKVAYAAAHPAA